jgi:hypothetical protein
MSSVYLAMEFSRLGAAPHDPAGYQCLRCQSILTIHQPDVDLPDRLLGTCRECRCWFLVNAGSGILVRLPDQDAFKEA